MAKYDDFSVYKMDNMELKDIYNIGWLGDVGSFQQGMVSEEFLVNLWEYYKCPIFSTRNKFQNVSLDGEWKFFSALSNGREVMLGSSEIRILDKEKGVIYASPDLIIHYIVNHNYLPPKEYIKAVIEGPKPNSEDYCNMIRESYKDIAKREGQNGVCPFCHSKCASFAYKEEKKKSSDQGLRVVDSSMIKRKNEKLEEYFYYLLCKDCGHLYEFDFCSIMSNR